MSVFEVIMLACFGAAWPPSIYKSYTSRTSRGKSLPFLCVIFLGYVAGILHKVNFNPDWVVCLYAFNALMVAIDCGLWFRNTAYDRRAL